jgi:formylmethanofuran dehydrogenase subunit E
MSAELLDAVADRWAQAQLRRIARRCAYCGEPTSPDNWARDTALGEHLMCRACWEGFELDT